MPAALAPYLLLCHLDTQTAQRAEDERAQASSPFLRDHDAEFLADTSWDEHLQGYLGLILNGHRRCNAAGRDVRALSPRRPEQPPGRAVAGGTDCSSAPSFLLVMRSLTLIMFLTLMKS